MADGSTFLSRTVQAVRYVITGVDTAWMGPQQPLVPQQQQTAGRQYDYPVSYNVNMLPRSDRRIKFPQLKALAENCGVMRTVIERQKDLIESFDWNVKLRETAPGKRPATGSDKNILAIEAMLRSPDADHDWSQWLRALLHQVFVYDALTIYRRRDMGGRPCAFELMDGATIKPLLDATGRRPKAPDPAYQQRLRGVPAVDYSTEELLYWPKNVTIDSPYGSSPVEWVIDYVETFIERALSQKAWFTEGNLADGFFTGPPEWKSEQLKVVAGWWDSLYGGNVRQRRKALFLPNGSKYESTKGAPLKDEFDEWLARVICYAFSTSPQPFIKQVSRGNQESQQEVAEEGGVAVYMQFVKRVVDRLLAEDFTRPDLEFVWSDDREFDPLVAAQIDDIRLKNGSRVINEVRDNNGEDPIDGGDTALIYTPATGAVTLDSILNPPEPVAPVIMAHPGDAASPAPKPGETKPAAKTPPAKAVAEKLAKRAAANEKAPSAARPTAMSAKRRLTKKLAPILAKAGTHVADEVKTRLMAMGKAADDAGGDSLKRALAVASGVNLQALADVEAALTDEISDLAQDSSGLVLAQVGVSGTDGAFDQVFDRAVAWAKTHAADLVSANGDDSLIASTRGMLRDMIAAGLDDNLGSAAIADQIGASHAFSPDRAELIANTEIGNANSQGSLQGLKIARDIGVKVQKSWSVSGADCCDECQDNEDAGAIDLDDDFPSGDDAPLAHPRCGCVLVPEVADDEG